MSVIFKETPAKKAHPRLITKMESIVKLVIEKEKFRRDFEVNDVKMMETSSSNTFAWYVYDCGTYLIPLNNVNEVISFQKEWILGAKALEGKKPSDGDRLYVLNVLSGDIRRVFGFKDDDSYLIDRLLKFVV
jgi:hypothetical protein